MAIKIGLFLCVMMSGWTFFVASWNKKQQQEKQLAYIICLVSWCSTHCQNLVIHMNWQDSINLSSSQTAHDNSGTAAGTNSSGVGVCWQNKYD